MGMQVESHIVHSRQCQGLPTAYYVARTSSCQPASVGGWGWMDLRFSSVFVLREHIKAGRSWR